MHPMELQNQIHTATMQHSGIEARDYLGMSGIALCPLTLYRQQICGRANELQGHLFCEAGYMEEQRMMCKLAAIDGIDLAGIPAFPYPAFRAELDRRAKAHGGRLGPAEGFSDFGGRLQGHTDGSWDGELLEIKSTIAAKMPKGFRVMSSHYWQCQIYMYYGGYRRAQVIYIARDTREIKVIGINFNDRVAESARLKAASVLEAVDRREPPDCECGYCEKGNEYEARSTVQKEQAVYSA